MPGDGLAIQLGRPLRGPRPGEPLKHPRTAGRSEASPQRSVVQHPPEPRGQRPRVARRHGKTRLPVGPGDLRGRGGVMQWLFWQMGGLGPMLGQNHHFRGYAAEKITYAIERYTKETERLYGVLDEQLEHREFIAGDYSIADMACYPWIVLHDRQGQDLKDYPNLNRWFEAIQIRPAVVRAYAVADSINPNRRGMSDEAKKILFGQGRRVKSSEPSE